MRLQKIMFNVQMSTKCQPLQSSSLIMDNVVIHKIWQYHHHLTTKIWHQTNMFLFGCKMNCFFTVCISKLNPVKFVKNMWLLQWKIMKNGKEPHFFDKNPKLTTNYWYYLKGDVFLYVCDKNYIQGLTMRLIPA